MVASKLGEMNPSKRADVAAKIGAHHRQTGRFDGPNHPNFKGQWTVTREGRTRAFVWIDKEMQARLGVKRPYVARARVVWLEAHPGETLTSRQIIHHVNEDTMDDRPENLERLVNQRKHAQLHGQKPNRGSFQPGHQWSAETRAKALAARARRRSK